MSVCQVSHTVTPLKRRFLNIYSIIVIIKAAIHGIFMAVSCHPLYPLDKTKSANDIMVETPSKSFSVKYFNQKQALNCFSFRNISA